MSIGLWLIISLLVFHYFYYRRRINKENIKNSLLVKRLILINELVEKTHALQSLEKTFPLVFSAFSKLIPEYSRGMYFHLRYEKGKKVLFLLAHDNFENIPDNLFFPLDERIGIVSRVAVEQEPYETLSPQEDYFCDQKFVEITKIGSFVALPVVINKETIGVFVIETKNKKRKYSSEELNLLSLFASQIGIALESARLYEEVENIAFLDGLTEIYNRRYFEKALQNEIERVKRYGGKVSLLMIDIDDFKVYNDTHGHPAGDEALYLVAKILKENTRNVDVVARYGGEEFGIILIQTGKKEAVEKGEALRKLVSEYKFPHEETQPGGDITISVGVATCPEDAIDKKDLVKKADEALYRAKKEGKNRVCGI